MAANSLRESLGLQAPSPERKGSLWGIGSLVGRVRDGVSHVLRDEASEADAWEEKPAGDGASGQAEGGSGTRETRREQLPLDDRDVFSAFQQWLGQGPPYPPMTDVLQRIRAEDCEQPRTIVHHFHRALAPLSAEQFLETARAWSRDGRQRYFFPSPSRMSDPELGPYVRQLLEAVYLEKVEGIRREFLRVDDVQGLRSFDRQMKGARQDFLERKRQEVCEGVESGRDLRRLFQQYPAAWELLSTLAKARLERREAAARKGGVLRWLGQGLKEVVREAVASVRNIAAREVLAPIGWEPECDAICEEIHQEFKGSYSLRDAADRLFLKAKAENAAASKS